ncbi:Collagen alpha 1(xviii) chain [Halocaridina rubra]|uniref:Collagen alpha 1(Xviii) chain n=1 Tax=Halocaridina rubra TaxID=373956 RepID=A0AAN8XCG3_HALRR
MAGRPQKYVWHGSDLLGERSLSSYCDAWNSESREAVGVASSLLKNRLLGQEKLGCHNSFVVLCIEATSHARLRKRRHAGSQEENMTEEEYHELLNFIDLSSGEA